MKSNRRNIKVLPYVPLWPELFINKAEKIKSALGENFINVHHNGYEGDRRDIPMGKILQSRSNGES